MQQQRDKLAQKSGRESLKTATGIVEDG